MKEKILFAGLNKDEQNVYTKQFFNKYDLNFVQNVAIANTVINTVKQINNNGSFLYKAVVYTMKEADKTAVDTIKKLKQLNEESSIIVIASANSFELEKSVRGLGILYYFVGPFDLNDLDKLLQAAVSAWDRKFTY
jgi:response regulator of citrate/malate metabolism